MNHDAEVDIRKPLPYADNVADFILAEHVLEHVTGPEALRFLDECQRILKPGGVLRVCCPVLNRLDWYAKRDIIMGHGHQIFFTSDSLELLLSLSFSSFPKKSWRMACDGHHRIIGVEKDDCETDRWELMK